MHAVICRHVARQSRQNNMQYKQTEKNLFGQTGIYYRDMHNSYRQTGWQTGLLYNQAHHHTSKRVNTTRQLLAAETFWSGITKSTVKHRTATDQLIPAKPLWWSSTLSSVKSNRAKRGREWQAIMWESSGGWHWLVDQRRCLVCLSRECVQACIYTRAKPNNNRSSGRVNTEIKVPILISK